jgi:hypothetical protein
MKPQWGMVRFSFFLGSRVTKYSRRCTTKTILLCTTLSVFLVVGLRSSSAAQEKQEVARPNVKIATITGAIVVSGEVTGPYSQHLVVFQQLMEYVGKSYAAVGACFGVYPRDPDAVEGKDLKWQVGVRVMPGKPLGYGNSLPIEEMPVMSAAKLRHTIRVMKRAEVPYELRMMPATTAAIIESNVGNAAHDGLDMIPWMARNGYVQTAPTRLEHLSCEGPVSDMTVRIIIPMKEQQLVLSRQTETGIVVMMNARQVICRTHRWV